MRKRKKRCRVWIIHAVGGGLYMALVREYVHNNRILPFGGASSNGEQWQGCVCVCVCKGCIDGHKITPAVAARGGGGHCGQKTAGFVIRVGGATHTIVDMTTAERERARFICLRFLRPPVCVRVMNEDNTQHTHSEKQQTRKPRTRTRHTHSR